MAQKSDDDRLLAEIPWIERPIGDKRLEDINFYKQIGENCPLEEKIRRLQLFWMLNETFPFYLPERYHAMDCLALHKNSKDGNYWANATVFLFNSSVYGHRFLSDVHGYLKKGVPDLKIMMQLLSLYKSIKKKYLKNNLEESKSAAEFLLDPWVLLQLPLQPMLMYQWAVALLAEAFKLEKYINEINNYACKRNLIVPLNKLVDMHKKLTDCTNSIFSFFFAFIVTGQANDVHEYLQVFNNISNNHLVKCYPEILPIIEFVLSQKFKDVIKAIKRLACESSSANNCKDLWYCDIEEPRYIFSFLSNYNAFWNCEGKLDDLMHPSQVDVIKTEEVTIEEKEGQSLELWQQFVDENIIQPGLLQGVHTKFTLAEMFSKDNELLLLLDSYQSHKELLASHTGHHKTGIIYNVVSLQLEAFMDKMFTMLIRYILYNCKPLGSLFLNAVDCQGPKYTIREAIVVLSCAQPDKKWSYKNILKRVKDNFDEKLMEFPDFDQGAENIAIHLQERLRRLVLKMIERQYKSLKEENFTLYPECQFVQLILPCFVASFLDLDKDPSASQETKRKYFNFLHELVKSYETFEFSRKITSPDEGIPFACVVHGGFTNMYLQLRCEYIENVLRDMLCNSKICDDFVSKGVSSKFVNESWVVNSNCLAKTVKTMYWSNLIFMLNSRVRSVFRKIGIPEDPELYIYESDIFTKLRNVERLSTEQVWISKLQQLIKYDSEEQELFDKEMQKLLDSGVPSQMIQDAQNISESNLDGIALYLMIKYCADEILNLYNNEIIRGPGFLLDPVVSVFWSLFTKDKWKAKLDLAKIYDLREENEDPTLISFDIAESNSCYKTIIDSITPDGKVEMSRPGEITFFPVKHCRWCGQVKVKEFRVCPLCDETPDYPDLNFFCSEICETESLEKQHEEEHINFLMQQCGIDK